MNNIESFAGLIRITREDRGMSQRDVVRESGGRIPKSTLWHIENGTMIPPMKVVVMLADVLCVPRDAFTQIALRCRMEMLEKTLKEDIVKAIRDVDDQEAYNRYVSSKISDRWQEMLKKMSNPSH